MWEVDRGRSAALVATRCTDAPARRPLRGGYVVATSSSYDENDPDEARCLSTGLEVLRIGYREAGHGLRQRNLFCLDDEPGGKKNKDR